MVFPQDKAKMVCVKLQIIKKDTFNIVHINACGRANFGCQLMEITVNALFPIFQLFSNCFQSISIADISHPTVEFIAINWKRFLLQILRCIVSNGSSTEEQDDEEGKNWTKMIGKMDRCRDEEISTPRTSNTAMETDGIVMPANQPTNRSIKLYEIVICVSFLFFNLIFRSNSNAWRQQKSNKVERLRDTEQWALYNAFVQLVVIRTMGFNYCKIVPFWCALVCTKDHTNNN